MGKSSGERRGRNILRLSVASYNIHRCVGTDRLYLPRRTAEVIRGVDADLIGLQEVDSRPPGGPRDGPAGLPGPAHRLSSHIGTLFRGRTGMFRERPFHQASGGFSPSGGPEFFGDGRPGALSTRSWLTTGTEVRVLVTHLGPPGAGAPFSGRPPEGGAW